MKDIMKNSILLPLFLLIVSGAIAQSAGKISGSISGKNAKASDGATVSLLRAKDSSTVKIPAANKEGIYSFENILAGQYLITVTAVGHQKVYSTLIKVGDQQPVVVV